MGDEFLGAGWKFPFIQGDSGEIALAYHEEDIREAIRIILGTAPGERVMRPDFGCGIHDFVFAPNTVRTHGLIRFRVEESLNRWEPRIDLISVKVGADSSQGSAILIEIEYRVKSTDSRFNLVYPFYLERGGEGR